MSYHPTIYWQQLDNNKIQCDLCPHHCQLKEGQQGLCFVRANQNSALVLTSYGRSSGFCIDPIEKKPLNHFYPGTPVLSFGTAGCNLACKYCQNWDMSTSRKMDTLADAASPEQLALAAHQLGCRSIAYTYNDPVIFHEYAIDVAAACAEKGVKSVAVTAGYINPEPREAFFAVMDAANVDLKSFSEAFYHKLTGGHLQPVLETLQYIYHQTNCWLEITTLLIPGQNDSPAEIDAMTQWIISELGPEVPIHFSAFHPDYRLQEIPATPASTLLMARDIAIKNGMHYVYVGNVHQPEADSSYCHQCGELLIGRDWYQLNSWQLDENGCCRHCGTACAGHFDPQPGRWGARRQPVRLSDFSIDPGTL